MANSTRTQINSRRMQPHSQQGEIQDECRTNSKRSRAQLKTSSDQIQNKRSGNSKRTQGTLNQLEPSRPDFVIVMFYRDNLMGTCYCCHHLGCERVCACRHSYIYSVCCNALSLASCWSAVRIFIRGRLHLHDLEEGGDFHFGAVMVVLASPEQIRGMEAHTLDASQTPSFGRGAGSG